MSGLGELLATDELALRHPSVDALGDNGSVKSSVPTRVDVGGLEDLLTPTVVDFKVERLDILVDGPEVGVDTIDAVDARDVSSRGESVREDDETSSTCLDEALLDSIGLTAVIIPDLEADCVEALVLVRDERVLLA